MVVTILGSGRVGLTLARALRRDEITVHLLTRADGSARAFPDGLAVAADREVALREAAVILLAVPDDAIHAVATELATRDGWRADQVVLHCSGMHDREVLSPLRRHGVALGSFHPLQSFPDPSGNPERLHGSPAVVEGDPAAVAAARALATRLGLRPVVEIGAGGKVKYHAAAVFAANYLVVLAAVAQRLAGEAGIPPQEARELFAPLMRETVAQLAVRSPGAILTGPIARGDQGTVATHLATLDASTRELYRLLAAEAARLVSARG